MSGRYGAGVGVRTTWRRDVDVCVAQLFAVSYDCDMVMMIFHVRENGVIRKSADKHFPLS